MTDDDKLDALRSLAHAVGNMAMGEHDDPERIEASDLIRWAVEQIEAKRAKPQGKTVRVRMLVGVSPDGGTASATLYESGEDEMRAAQRFIERMYDQIDASAQWRIIEADVPAWEPPAVPVVEGEVTQ